MPRVKRGTMTHKRHKRVLKKASGYWGARHRLFKTAKEAVMKALDDAFRGRKLKKRDFRRMWIVRINAGCRLNDITYNRFINGLIKANIAINRKVLAEMAIADPQGFGAIVERARAALA
jgi:large subunit ribosomal protein L20